MPDVIPWLRYEDATAAIEWLCRAFGMREHFVIRDEHGGIAHAQLTLGDGMIMVGEARDDGLNVKTPAAAGCVTQGIYAVVDDVEGAYARARGAGAEIVNELVKTEHGSTDFVVRDIGGHVWNFGTYRPDRIPGVPPG
jgi:uncharacterized glyoxalase superfamily protein PhnB